MALLAFAGGPAIGSPGQAGVALAVDADVLVRLQLAPGARKSPPAGIDDALAGRLTAEQLATLRSPHSRAHGQAIAASQERSRALALSALQRRFAASERRVHRIGRAVEARGGRVIERDPLAGSLVVLIARGELAQLARRPAIASVTPARLDRPRAGGIELQTAAVGAPTWWAAGHTGGTGGSDSAPVDLAILDDKIHETQPAFHDVAFLRPDGALVDTHCGGNTGCRHGSQVAGAAVSQGVDAANCPAGFTCTADDAANRGVSPGAEKVLDADTDGRAGCGSELFAMTAWSLGFDQTDPCGDNLEGATDPAEVANLSLGSGPAQSDDTPSLRNWDWDMSTFGWNIAMPSGNDGPDPNTVDDPCIAYNALCTTAVGRSDLQIANFSGRGPTPGGRKKPDLAAIGASTQAGGNIELVDSGYQTTGSLWDYDNGTSFASPQVAAGALLLAGSGISDPLAQKAILIDSAAPGRATPAQAMGTQTAWQADWGWGMLDLDAAHDQRMNFHTDAVAGASDGSAGVRLYAATTQGAGDTATLVWHRRAVSCFGAGCVGVPFTLSNLQLLELDATTGAQRQASQSAIDNVEQVRTGGAADVVYKVKNASATVDGRTSEPFAIAATHQVTPLANPQPEVAASSSAGKVHQGDEVTVDATITNPSDDLTGENASVTLQLPAGVELAPGSDPQTQPLGTLATGGRAQVSWRVRGTADGDHDVTAEATAQRYGETFSGTDKVDLLVDSTPPAVSITAPTGERTDPAIPVSWSASDGLTGVTARALQASVDGGPWTSWINPSANGSATYSGSVGHSYSFRARATDGNSNTSGWKQSPTVSIVPPPPPPPAPPPPDRDGDGVPDSSDFCPFQPGAAPRGCPVAERSSSLLRVHLARFLRSYPGLVVYGTLRPGARRWVRIFYRCAPWRTILRGYAIPTRTGRWLARGLIPAPCRRSPYLRVWVYYPGDSDHLRRLLRGVLRPR